MAMFDFLNGVDTPSPSGNLVNPDTNSQFGGGTDILTKLLQDPNILQGMGNAGAALSSGASVGEALNPANLIRQVQTQKAGNELLKQILGKVTPKGQPGLDSATVTQTADGTKFSGVMPSAANLNTYGTNVPPESMSTSGNYPSVFNQNASAGGGTDQSPFWKALFQ